MKNKLLISAALSGLLGAAALATKPVTPNEKSQSEETVKKEKTGECWGVNSCKGQGDCGGKGHSCAGGNTCKGQGWKTMTEKECKEKKGTFKS